MAPSESVTNTDAHCAIAGSSDEATMKCQPAAATQGSSYHYHTALVVDAEGTAYVIACRVSLVTNFWCKGLAPGTAFQGRLAQGNLAIADRDKSHDYKLLTSAYVGPLPGKPACCACARRGVFWKPRLLPGGQLRASLLQAGLWARRRLVLSLRHGQPAVTRRLVANQKARLHAPKVQDSNGSCAPPRGACVTFVSEPGRGYLRGWKICGEHAFRAQSPDGLTRNPHRVRAFQAVDSHTRYQRRKQDYHSRPAPGRRSRPVG